MVRVAMAGTLTASLALSGCALLAHPDLSLPGLGRATPTPTPPSLASQCDLGDPANVRVDGIEPAAATVVHYSTATLLPDGSMATTESEVKPSTSVELTGAEVPDPVQLIRAVGAAGVEVGWISGYWPDARNAEITWADVPSVPPTETAQEMVEVGTVPTVIVTFTLTCGSSSYSGTASGADYAQMADVTDFDCADGALAADALEQVALQFCGGSS
jgi:hypothetical protein